MPRRTQAETGQLLVWQHNLALMQSDAAFLLQNLHTKGDDIEENLMEPKSKNMALTLIALNQCHACFNVCL